MEEMLTSHSSTTVKPEWFGKNVTVLLSNGKAVTGELSEAGQNYLVLDSADGQTQIMVHAIILIRLAETGREET